MRVRINPRRKIKNIVLFTIITGIVIVILSGVLLYLNRDRNPIPNDLRSALVFSPLIVPLEDDTFTTRNYTLNRAENNDQILSYAISFEDKEVAVSQYTQPTEFIEIPEYKDRFLTNVVQQNEVVQTANGAIYIGQLSKQDNAQLGVMLENGLIVFMRPNQPLDAAEWRRIGENLQIQTID